MTYNYRRQEAYRIGASVARYTPSYHAMSPARYTPSHQAMYHTSRQRSVPSGAVPRAVRYTQDLQLGGFWKECGAVVEFITYDSPNGRRLVTVCELLGIPTRRSSDAR